MARLRLPLCLCLLVSFTVVTVVSGQDDETNGGLHPNSNQIEKLCKDRPENEYFRLTTVGDCRDVVRCDKAGLTGTIRLAGVKCPNGLAFDIFKQTCDWKGRVSNCDKLESKLLSLRHPPRSIIFVIIINSSSDRVEVHFLINNNG